MDYLAKTVRLRCLLNKTVANHLANQAHPLNAFSILPTADPFICELRRIGDHPRLLLCAWK